MNEVYYTLRLPQCCLVLVVGSPSPMLSVSEIIKDKGHHIQMLSVLWYLSTKGHRTQALSMPKFE